MSGVTHVNIFCFVFKLLIVAYVEVAVDVNKYPDKSILILFEISFLISGVIHVNLFCLFVFIVFKLPSTYDFKG